MPKNVPAEFTGRFSIKPKPSRSRPKAASIKPSSEEATSSSLPDSLRDESALFHERKRRKEEDHSTSDRSSLSASPSQEIDDELGQYSQQLDVQSPHYQRTKRHGEQVSRPFRPKHQTSSIDIHTTSRPEGKLSTDREKVLQIFRSAWTRPSSGRLDASATAHRLAHFYSLSTKVNQVAEVSRGVISALVEFISKHPRSIDFVLTSFDEAVKLLFAKETTATGSTQIHDHTSSQVLINEFRECILHQNSRLRRSSKSLLSRTGGIEPAKGILDATDQSNLKPKNSRVQANLKDVMIHVKTRRLQRRNWILTAAIHARCLANGISGIEGGWRRLVSEIDNALNQSRRQRHQRPHHHLQEQQQRARPILIERSTDEDFPESHMIGACIMLRGSAKSLMKAMNDASADADGDNSAPIDAEEQLEEWKTALESFLLPPSEQRHQRRRQQPCVEKVRKDEEEGKHDEEDSDEDEDDDNEMMRDDNDFVIKSHAAVSPITS